MADQIKKIEMRERGDGTYNQLLYPKTSIDMVVGLQSALDSKETPAGAQAKANQAEANAKAASVPISRTVNGLALSSNITLNHNHVGAVNAVSTGSTADPNTTQEPYILTNHANSPGQGIYWHIHTYFYSSKTGNRAQQAISYNGAEPKMFIRHNYGGSWTAWQEVTGGGSMPVLAASNTLQESFNTERSLNRTIEYMLVGKHVPKGTGEVKIQIEMRRSGNTSFYLRAFQPYKSSVVSTIYEPFEETLFPIVNWETNLGSIYTRSEMVEDNSILVLSGNSDAYTTFSSIINVAVGHPIYIFMGANNANGTIYCRNLRFLYSVM